ncbi:MAG: hypothetical protein M0Q38_04800 [Bacteroidales bacterium]|jgi:hypothetical protein|nr:hypothetical protein [Bacteroidales bacterium]
MKTIFLFLVVVMISAETISHNNVMKTGSNSRSASRPTDTDFEVYNYGFDLRMLYTGQPISIRDGCQLTRLDNDYFFVNKQNKICRLYGLNNIWYVDSLFFNNRVAQNTQFIPDGEGSLFYVNSNRMEVRKIIYEKGSWQDVKCFSCPTLVRLNSNLTYNAPSSSLFYINLAGQIYRSVDDTSSNTWTTPMPMMQSKAARVGANLLFTASNAMYYIGTNDLVLL